MHDTDQIGITFKASFAKLSTLSDGGIRIAFDISLSELQSALKLPSLRDRVLQVAIVPEPLQSKAVGQW